MVIPLNLTNALITNEHSLKLNIWLKFDHFEIPHINNGHSLECPHKQILLTYST